MADKNFLGALNIKKRCGAAGVGLWQCPHFLFIIMGLVVIVAILATDIVARRYAEPEMAALIVLMVAAVLFVLGNIVVRSFENVVEASRLKSEFVSIVSHELRSPLSAVKWSLNLFKSEGHYQNLNDEASSMISTIGEQNQKMIKIVNTLLEVRRIEDGKIDLEPEKIYLKQITEDALKNLNDFARASNIKLELDSRSETASFADRQKINFAVSGLIENAIRYSTGGSSVKIEIFEKSGRIFWRITDSGSGIPKEDRSKIFDKFFRAHNVYRYRSGGLGVGLFLSKAFIEASGGKIGFSSEDNDGSVFWFYLPIKNS